jgi:propionyl-CoA carboxylase alpha chain
VARDDTRPLTKGWATMTRENGIDRSIRKVLIANRGEIARRVIRTCKKMGISTVAVYSDPDANALFVKEADEAVALGGASPSSSYLSIEKIMKAAALTGADALHPGYGFLSENPALPSACERAGIIFIGPPASVMEAMGSKLAAKEIARSAGVPTLLARAVDLRDPNATGDGLALKGLAEEVGWPVLVKASAGGGGRGMRIVPREQAESLEEVVASASREALSAFGDATVFLEHYIERPRHIEVQIFGDMHGNVAHLFERECSIQRRYQKIIEESPSPKVDATALQQAAVALGRAIGYRGAGTVEFVVDQEGNFYFLEVNTRLQVEHPVTECITGLDLVRLQILIAEGEPLPETVLHPRTKGHAIEARLYAEDPLADYRPSTGRLHCFEIPTSESSQEEEGQETEDFNLREPAGFIRLDSAVESGDVVSIHYDPMLAKVIAWAPTRREAARGLRRALLGARLHGVVTNRDLLVAILGHEEFLVGETDTGFLERHPPEELLALDGADTKISGSSSVTQAVTLQSGEPLQSKVGRHALVAALALGASNTERFSVFSRVPPGWRNNPSTKQVVKLSLGGTPSVVKDHLKAGEDGIIEVCYRLRFPFQAKGDHRPLEVYGSLSGEGGPGLAEVDDASRSSLLARVFKWSSSEIDIEIGEIRRAYAIQILEPPEMASDGEISKVSVDLGGSLVFIDGPDGSSRFTVVPRFPVAASEQQAGSLTAPMPGTVVRIETRVGEQVEAGSTLVVLEAMKMEHAVRAPVDGVVSDLRVKEGQVVESGELLVVIGK